MSRHQQPTFQVAPQQPMQHQLPMSQHQLPMSQHQLQMPLPSAAHGPMLHPSSSQPQTQPEQPQLHLQLQPQLQTQVPRPCLEPNSQQQPLNQPNFQQPSPTTSSTETGSHAQTQERPNFQMALQPPPQDRLYESFDTLYADLRAFTRSQGYAVTIVSSINRDPEGRYRRYNLSCSKGGRTYASHSKGIRQARSGKTGCPMRMKAVQEKSWPYNDKWHVVVQCHDHNHEPFTGEPGSNVPTQFRKIEQDGVRWLTIMHREAQCTLRQLTIGIRISFGEKYQYVKKSDVRNMLAKIKRGEEGKAAEAAAVAATAQNLPANESFALLSTSHHPLQPRVQVVDNMPALPQDLQVVDPDLDSDDGGHVVQ